MAVVVHRPLRAFFDVDDDDNMRAPENLVGAKHWRIRKGGRSFYCRLLSGGNFQWEESSRAFLRAGFLFSFYAFLTFLLTN